MNFKTLALIGPLLVSPALLLGQGKGVTPADLLKPLQDSWPTYNGDYTGKRYSLLKQVDRSTVKNLTLAWMTRVTPGAGRPDEGGGGRRGRQKENLIIGGEGTGDLAIGGGSIKGSVLEVDGTLYFTTPDNAWAVDARDGHELWHYFWKTKGGTHIGNRGLGDVEQLSVHGDARRLPGLARCQDRQGALAQADRRTGARLFLDAGADRHRQSRAGGHGNDIDSPGFLQSFDPETGDLQWKHYTVPMKKGDPGLGHLGQPGCGQARWRADLGSRRLRSGNAPLYLRHGQSHAGLHDGTRGEGDNLFTCTLIALNVDTGKMAWYFQTSPHDMHDYDSAQTPVLVDAPFNGKMRKLVLTAAATGITLRWTE